jgi:hypothetical protein
MARFLAAPRLGRTPLGHTGLRSCLGAEAGRALAACRRGPVASALVRGVEQAGAGLWVGSVVHAAECARL